MVWSESCFRYFAAPAGLLLSRHWNHLFIFAGQALGRFVALDAELGAGTQQFVVLELELFDDMAIELLTALFLAIF